uniref:trypsin n=1 Tax=Poecilia latipinna TaxID=48699 RepID=A0A3B3UKU8_9TELE
KENMICFVVLLLISSQRMDAPSAVFVEKHEAASVLRRWRRANSGFLEELKQGNLQRECIEEICDYEEAREVFEDDEKTVSSSLLWISAAPAGVRRIKTLTNSFYSLGCLYQNGNCEHFCDGSGGRRKCFCADGYQLGDDGKKCVPKGEGKVTDQVRLVGANHCNDGDCPWQVLIKLNGSSHCGGVLVRPDWVITAAHCVHGQSLQHLTVVAGENNLDMKGDTEQTFDANMAIPHDNYNPATGDSDIALVRMNGSVVLNRYTVPICLPTKDFAERELLPVRYHTVSGWGKRTTGGNAFTSSGRRVSPTLRKMSVPIVQNSQCSQKAKFNFTDNMLCAGYLDGNQESCRGDDGSPLVTEYRSTSFLTGVVAWGRGCSRPGYYGVYTKVAMFVDWAEETMKNTPILDVLQEQTRV